MSVAPADAMLALPASNACVLRQVIEPALAVLPADMRTPEAECFLLAVGRQESGFRTRDQGDDKLGPALGFWQQQRNNVLGVMNHPDTSKQVWMVCGLHDIRYGSENIWLALASNDEFACQMARLLMWTDPHPLPKIGDITGAWDMYDVRLWRPGKPRYSRWKRTAYPEAVKALEAA